MAQDRKLEHLYDPFRQKIVVILNELQPYCSVHMPGCEWKLIEGFRTAAYQNELFQKGRTIPPKGPKYVVTFRDGYRLKSCHQSSLAVDIVPFQGNKVLWNADLEYWAYLGHLARLHGLEWGGDWRMRDFPHIQWPDEDKSTYRAAALWQKQVGLR